MNVDSRGFSVMSVWVAAVPCCCKHMMLCLHGKHV